MTYASQADLVARYGHDEIVQLSDHEPIGAIDTDTVGRALTDADETINSYVGSRYKVPLTPVPRFVVKLAADIARYYLHRHGVPDNVQQAYDDAIAFLKDIGVGKASLDAAGVEAPTANRNEVKISGPPRVMSRDSLRGL